MAALPAGTLSGAPKVRAMQIIDELETEKRGVGYAGGVGYFSADGSVDTCIVLRTALFKDGMIYVQAGGGVVADSDPASEHQECINKARALFRAAEEEARRASPAPRAGRGSSSADLPPHPSLRSTRHWPGRDPAVRRVRVKWHGSGPMPPAPHRSGDRRDQARR